METQQAAGDKASPSLTMGEAIKLKPLRDGLLELESAYELMRGSRAAYKEKVDAIAEKSGVAPSVLRAFIAARMADDAEKANRKAEQARQLSLMFDEVGV